MKTDKQIHALLASSPEAFRFLTGGIELPGPYQGRSVAFKELERRADHVFEPTSGDGPTYIIEVQAQHSGDMATAGNPHRTRRFGAAGCLHALADGAP
ncbi:MAG: DUF2887 domain-containing protein [Candidatus Contendobacter sp.]